MQWRLIMKISRQYTLRFIFSSFFPARFFSLHLSVSHSRFLFRSIFGLIVINCVEHTHIHTCTRSHTHAHERIQARTHTRTYTHSHQWTMETDSLRLFVKDFSFVLTTFAAADLSAMWAAGPEARAAAGLPCPSCPELRPGEEAPVLLQSDDTAVGKLLWERVFQCPRMRRMPQIMMI